MILCWLAIPILAYAAFHALRVGWQAHVESFTGIPPSSDPPDAGRAPVRTPSAGARFPAPAAARTLLRIARPPGRE